MVYTEEQMIQMIAMQNGMPDLVYTSAPDFLKLHIESETTAAKYKTMIDAHETSAEITKELENSTLYAEHYKCLKRTTGQFCNRFTMSHILSMTYSLENLGKIYASSEHYAILVNQGIKSHEAELLNEEYEYVMKYKIASFNDGNKALALQRTREGGVDSLIYNELIKLRDSTTDAFKRVPINAAIKQELERSSMYANHLEKLKQNTRFISQKDAHAVMVSAFYSLQMYNKVLCAYSHISRYTEREGVKNRETDMNRISKEHYNACLNNVVEAFDDRTKAVALEHTRDAFDNLICGEQKYKISYCKMKGEYGEQFIEERPSIYHTDLELAAHKKIALFCRYGHKSLEV